MHAQQEISFLSTLLFQLPWNLASLPKTVLQWSPSSHLEDLFSASPFPIWIFPHGDAAASPLLKAPSFISAAPYSSPAQVLVIN